MSRPQLTVVYDGDDRPVFGPREPGDDFLCIRYQVWYPSIDCAFRTKFKTAPGCLNCDQGRFNFKRHADRLRTARFDLATPR